MIYVVSDLHGKFNKLVQLLNYIHFGSQDTLYVLGDVIDRGEAPVVILQLIMQLSNIKFLLGNHEEMCLSYYKEKKYLDRAINLVIWEKSGGTPTINQIEALSIGKKMDILNYLETRLLYAIEDKFILSHSGLAAPKNQEGLSIEEIMAMQNNQSLLWSWSEFFDHPAIKGYTTIFGHVTTNKLYGYEEDKIIPLKIWYDEDRGRDKIGIDCGAVFEAGGGRLACLRLDDGQEYYI